MAFLSSPPSALLLSCSSLVKTTSGQGCSAAGCFPHIIQDSAQLRCLDQHCNTIPCGPFLLIFLTVTQHPQDTVCQQYFRTHSSASNASICPICQISGNKPISMVCMLCTLSQGGSSGEPAKLQQPFWLQVTCVLCTLLVLVPY